ncbi:hypothetical protein BSKO_00291 [Bryopsis sp. KO-2023]|nr:hypothetical protein BSKO_00291 [Bryopsis sp. KO-2023]
MASSWMIFVAGVCGVLLACTRCQSLELDKEGITSVLNDFMQLLWDEDAKLTGGGDSTDAPLGRKMRRLQQIDFGDIDADDIFEDFFDDFDIAASLSDFVDGLLTTPVLDFVANLPQNQEEAEAMVRAQYNEYCSDEEKMNGETVGDTCKSWVTKLELAPGECTVVDRLSQRFECEPPMLVYTRSAPTCTNRHKTAAEFVSKECKIAKSKGIAKEVVLGGGQFDVRLKLGRQNVDILSNLDLSDLADILDISDLF